MGEIRILPPELVNKIAAGEVVERPSSVLKELMENSIDAGTERIKVEAENGGMELIRVSDDGKGMSEEDARLCLERHSTSKIVSFEDLSRLASYGFRGEALSSIAAVSQFCLETKRRGDIGGVRLTCNGDNGVSRPYIDARPAGCPDGTTVTVKELFFNVPARRKFLKSVSTEYRCLLETFAQFALLHWDIGFQFFHNKKPIYQLNPASQWLERVKAVLGEQDMSFFQYHQSDMDVSGFLGGPASAGNNRKGQHIFVNQRAVFDPIISRAIKEAYGNLIAKDLYPVTILKIDVSPSLVDVNVHPRKTEVRFANPQRVYQVIFNAVSQNLPQSHGAAESTFVRPSYSIQAPRAEQSEVMSHAPSPIGASHQNFQANIKKNLELSKILLDASPSLDEHKSAHPNWRIIGQVRNSYIIVETPSGLFIFDQHAAAERILYEKLKRRVGAVSSQKLLMPFLIQLSPKEVELIREYHDIFEEAGFEAEEFGADSLKVAAIPQDLSQSDPKELILGILGDLQNTEDVGAKVELAESKRDKILKYAACRGAVKFHDKLQWEEIEVLLADIQNYKAVACPHGRPIGFEITWEEIERKVHRH
ncbi:MAG: DNA mismatch repair endonuclease MutL [Parcubacteria group bacterium]|nr:DNA mismatch repair endonuclease MutL [Parcubacteria group bacterium]